MIELRDLEKKVRHNGKLCNSFTMSTINGTLGVCVYDYKDNAIRCIYKDDECIGVEKVSKDFLKPINRIESDDVKFGDF